MKIQNDIIRLYKIKNLNHESDFMKIKMSILAIFLWTTLSDAAAPAPTPQATTLQTKCDPKLFDQMYHFIKVQLEFAEVNFQETTKVYKNLIALSASCEQYKEKLDELRTLIENKAEKYIQTKIKKAYLSYKVMTLDLLEPICEQVKIKTFINQGLPLQKALEVIAIINNLGKELDGPAYVEKNYLTNESIKRYVAKIIIFMNTFIHQLIKIGKDNPAIHSFLNFVIDSWESLSKALVQAHLTPSIQSYQQLKLAPPETSTILAQIADKLQQTGIIFAQWEEKKVQKDAPIEVVVANFSELFLLFESGLVQFESAINNATAYPSLLVQENNRDTLKQCARALNMIFRYLNEIVDHATQIVRNHSHQEATIGIFNNFVIAKNHLEKKIAIGLTQASEKSLSLSILKGIEKRLMKVKMGSQLLPKPQNAMGYQKSRLLKLTSDDFLEKAWATFNKIAQNKLSENASFTVVSENIRCRLGQLTTAMELLTQATKSMIRLAKVNYSSGNGTIDTQELEQNMVLLDELFNNFELFINELKKVSFYYSTPGEPKIRQWFDNKLIAMSTAIDNILNDIPMEIASSNSMWAELLEKLNSRLEELEETMNQPYFGVNDVESFKLPQN